MKGKLSLILLACSALCAGLALTACKEEHTLSHVPAVEPTCTEAGSVEYWTCSDCGKNFADEGAAEEISDVVIPATGHTEAIDAAVEPTCTETGLTEGKHCSVCGEVLVAQEVVEATGHHYENGVCVDCGEKEPTEGLELTLLGSSYAVTGIGTCTDPDVVIPSE